ncbi:hypothetical protein [Acetobacter oeni]|uniref:hypothetical protein n=1 Tax=Acetobacter oeni TaxID=304077 RepID=UPI0011BDFA3B|nr:hypothetical protein [Acetobacter oeni]MBB3883825.1 hypothetical protein [Acetobacter oeni]NHO19834.1 hypothetical protein [Acetobacter oeni]
MRKTPGGREIVICTRFGIEVLPDQANYGLADDGHGRASRSFSVRTLHAAHTAMAAAHQVARQPTAIMETRLISRSSS